MNRYDRPNSDLQVEHQVDDLRADRDVERRDRFVGDDDLRLQRQRARNGDPLPLAAGEFVRIALRMIRRQTDVFEQPRDALFGCRARGDAVNVQRLGDRKSDRQARIERREWILEHHLDVAPQRPELLGR